MNSLNEKKECTNERIKLKLSHHRTAHQPQHCPPLSRARFPDRNLAQSTPQPLAAFTHLGQEDNTKVLVGE